MMIVAGYQHTPEGALAVTQALSESRLRQSALVILVPSALGSDELAALPELSAELTKSDTEVSIRVAVRPDSLADELIELATELDADLIVIGLRRRSPVGKMLLGSVAQTVLLNAHVPVLAVRSH